MHILLDMDGVLTNFHLAALRTFNAERLLESWPIGEWSIPKVLGISEDDFWGVINQVPDFWFRIEPYPWLHELIDLTQSIGDYTISTSPSFDPDCAAQKIRWLQKHIDTKFHNYMIGHQKYLMANKNTVLIDDNENNVEQFQLAGGHKILFPMRTNKNYWLIGQKFEYLKQTLERIHKCSF